MTNFSHYKAIISDFDGTLTGADSKISEPVVTAIKKWTSMGKQFSIATGRQFSMIKKHCEFLGLQSPQIVRGGAEIIDPTSGNIIFSEEMEREVLNKLIMELEKNAIKFSIEKNTDVYFSFTPDYRRDDIEYKLLKDIPSGNFPKLVIYIPKEGESVMQTYVEEHLIHKFPQLNFVRSYSPIARVWDVTSIKATKHLAVLHLLEILRLKKEEVIGVGDGYNDFALLSACGYKVAMGNAPDELKTIADLVVKPYQEDGLAELITRAFF